MAEDEDLVFVCAKWKVHMDSDVFSPFFPPGTYRLPVKLIDVFISSNCTLKKIANFECFLFIDRVIGPAGRERLFSLNFCFFCFCGKFLTIKENLVLRDRDTERIHLMYSL